MSRIKGTAYTGGKMVPGGWEMPVVLDYTGMEFAEQVPLLADHSNETDDRIGVVTCAVDGDTLTVEGEVTSDNAKAQNIVSQAKGAHWQMSVGAAILEGKRINAGESASVNGKAVDGPFYHVTKCRIREVSVVAVGADESTSMTIAAGASFITFGCEIDDDEKPCECEEEEKNECASSDEDNQIAVETENDNNNNIQQEETNPMEEKEMTAEMAVQAERARVSGIRAVCNGETPEIESKAIEAGWSVEDTTAKVLASVRASRATTVPVAKAEEASDSIEASFAAACGLSEQSLIKSYGEKTAECASSHPMGLNELVWTIAHKNGVKAHASSNEMIRAAFSTADLGGILGNAANKRLLQSFQMQDVAALSLCNIADVNDFKEGERYRLNANGGFSPVIGGEIEVGNLDQWKATNKVETYAKNICVTRQMIINDDLGAFSKMLGDLGAQAARKIDEVLFSKLTGNGNLSDGNALFCSAHGNYKASGGSLTEANLAAAIAAMKKQKDADGKPVYMKAKYLVVPSDLWLTARKLVNDQALAVDGTSVVAKPNPVFAEGIQVIDSAFLSSATDWYLFADPAGFDTFELAFLRGKRTPTVEQGETDYTTLGMYFRCYYDFGVAPLDYRGVYYSKN